MRKLVKEIMDSIADTLYHHGELKSHSQDVETRLENTNNLLNDLLNEIVETGESNDD